MAEFIGTSACHRRISEYPRLQQRVGCVLFECMDCCRCSSRFARQWCCSHVVDSWRAPSSWSQKNPGRRYKKKRSRRLIPPVSVRLAISVVVMLDRNSRDNREMPWLPPRMPAYCAIDSSCWLDLSILCAMASVALNVVERIISGAFSCHRMVSESVSFAVIGLKQPQPARTWSPCDRSRSSK